MNQHLNWNMVYLTTMWILEGHKILRQEINVVSKYAKMEFLPSHGRKDL